jgi:hypothetical protein
MDPCKRRSNDVPSFRDLAELADELGVGLGDGRRSQTHNKWGNPTRILPAHFSEVTDGLRNDRYELTKGSLNRFVGLLIARENSVESC